MTHILGLLLLWIVLLAAVFVIPFGVAGTFIITLAAFVYGLFTGFQQITLGFVGVLLLVSLAVEATEFLLGGWAAKKAGSSRWGFWGAVIGGFLGALWMTPVLPFFGTLVGALVGAYVGAATLELLAFGDPVRALRAGWGAFLGAAGAKLLKIVVAIGMDVAIAVRLF